MNIRWVMIGVFLGIFLYGTAIGQVIVDNDEDVGIYTSLAVVNGNPAISYHKDTPSNYILKYARALDAAGSTWGTPITLDNPGSIYVVGLFTSLAVVNGNPAVSYNDWSYGDLKYIRATDANGSAWAAPVIVDSIGNVGLYTSLAVVNGNPAISYHDSQWSNGDLKYVRAANADGSVWGVPLTVDSAGIVGLFTSLAVVDGNPAIGYFDETNGNLKYVRAANADGSVWGVPLTVDSTGNVGKYASLAVVDGNPAISYFDETNFHLKFVRATDAEGNDWGTPVPVDSTGLVGRFLSLAVINGYPAISYYDISHTCLKYIQATNSDGSAWGTPVVADNAGDVGEYTSLAEVNGSPAVSYFDWTNRDLKYWRGSSEINLKQDTTDIEDGGIYDFGSHYSGTDTDVIFTIENTGTSNLIITIPATITGADAGQFNIPQQPDASVTPSGTTSFTIRFSPTSPGVKTASIAINNNDSDENPYELTITGTGTEAQVVPAMNVYGMLVLFLLITGTVLRGIFRRRQI